VTLSEFEIIVTQSQDRVFGYAMRLLGNRDHAADIVQDSMIRMWRNREKLETEGAVSWMLRVTHNACIDVLRRRKLETQIFAHEVDAERFESGGISPDRALETRDLRSHLDRALERLSEPYRSILILREIEDFRYDEICGALNLPMSTVKVYLHRGRRKLRKMIQEELYHELA
jgi:RNA polymerase sigma-70 factor, ECF subfamily